MYIDASVVMRIVNVEPGGLPEWRDITRPISSQLLRVECVRTIDRARITQNIEDEEVAERHSVVRHAISAFRILELDRIVLDRAAEPFPTLVGTLDAIHLATAVRARDEIKDLAFGTHDVELGTAALAVGFDVYGVEVS